MENKPGEIVFAQMKTRNRGDLGANTKKSIHSSTKRRLRNIAVSAAAVFCLGIGTAELLNNGESTATVMSHVATDFEYDETLGRLQFVSNILPESAMVFMQNEDEGIGVFAPSDAEVIHTWSQKEPWLEYAEGCDIAACSDAEVMTIVKNRDDEYTVRLLHDGGYESIYSGLTDISVAQYDQVLTGDILGQAAGCAAFELRKDGLSVNPDFIDPSGQSDI